MPHPSYRNRPIGLTSTSGVKNDGKKARVQARVQAWRAKVPPVLVVQTIRDPKNNTKIITSILGVENLSPSDRSGLAREASLKLKRVVVVQTKGTQARISVEGNLHNDVGQFVKEKCLRSGDDPAVLYSMHAGWLWEEWEDGQQEARPGGQSYHR